MSSKGAIGGPCGHNLKLTLDILSGVADEEQKKKGPKCFLWKFTNLH